MQTSSKTNFFTRGSRISLLPWRATQPLIKKQMQHLFYSFMVLRTWEIIKKQISHLFQLVLSLQVVLDFHSRLGFLLGHVHQESLFDPSHPTTDSSVLCIIYIKHHNTMYTYEMEMAKIQHQRICTHRQSFTSCWSDWSSFTH